MTVEGASPSFQLLALGTRTGLFVDTVLGAHTHQVRVFGLEGHNRFEELIGSPLHASWGPVGLEKVPDSDNYKVTLLVGAGAAGANAKPEVYLISERRIQKIEQECA